MDFETAAKLSGARFVVLRGQLAKLQRALISLCWIYILMNMAIKKFLCPILLMQIVVWYGSIA